MNSVAFKEKLGAFCHHLCTTKPICTIKDTDHERKARTKSMCNKNTKQPVCSFDSTSTKYDYFRYLFKIIPK